MKKTVSQLIKMWKWLTNPAGTRSGSEVLARESRGEQEAHHQLYPSLHESEGEGDVDQAQGDVFETPPDWSKATGMDLAKLEKTLSSAEDSRDQHDVSGAESPYALAPLSDERLPYNPITATIGKVTGGRSGPAIKALRNSSSVLVNYLQGRLEDEEIANLMGDFMEKFIIEFDEAEEFEGGERDFEVIRERSPPSSGPSSIMEGAVGLPEIKTDIFNKPVFFMTTDGGSVDFTLREIGVTREDQIKEIGQGRSVSEDDLIKRIILRLKGKEMSSFIAQSEYMDMQGKE